MTYEPKIGDEITFVNAEVNRDVVYTVTGVDDRWVTVTTPKGYVYQGEVFAYSLDRAMFDSLGPRGLLAAESVSQARRLAAKAEG